MCIGRSADGGALKGAGEGVGVDLGGGSAEDCCVGDCCEGGCGEAGR